MTLLTGCNLKDNVSQDGAVERGGGEVYESSSETTVSTAVDAELEIINQTGTANGSGL